MRLLACFLVPPYACLPWYLPWLAKQPAAVTACSIPPWIPGALAGGAALRYGNCLAHFLLWDGPLKALILSLESTWMDSDSWMGPALKLPKSQATCPKSTRKTSDRPVPWRRTPTGRNWPQEVNLISHRNLHALYSNLLIEHWHISGHWTSERNSIRSSAELPHHDMYFR